MKSLLFFCLSVLVINLSLAQSPYKKGDTLYVWANSGLNVRSTPNIEGKKKGGIPLGEQVTVQEVTDQRFNVYLIDATEEGDSSFALKGSWIRVASDQIEGYVLDSYLLPFPTPKAKSTLEEYLVGLSGKALVFKKGRNEHCEIDDETCYTRTSPIIQGLQLTYAFDGDYQKESLFMQGINIQ
ncbi:MAG: SH3 domain-containing protein, partial [Bacteroidota bacterium]